MANEDDREDEWEEAQDVRRLVIMIAISAVLAILITVIVGLVSGKVKGQEKEKQVEIDLKLAAIGEQLFSDPILSSDGSRRCLTCHTVRNNYTSGGLPTSLLTGKPLKRRAPSILDRNTGTAYFWDGRALTLESQAEQVLLNPEEMGNRNLTEILTRIQASGKYPSIQRESQILSALAEFERSLKSPRNRLDTYLSGENSTQILTEEETRGWDLFRGEAQCYKCHSGENFTDEKFHNTGVGIFTRKDGSQYTYDRGRYEITKRLEDYAAFKTPGLRGCSKALPYMHDASLKTLEEVVEFYNQGGIKNKYLSKDIQPLKLTDQQKKDLVALLRSL